MSDKPGDKLPNKYDRYFYDLACPETRRYIDEHKEPPEEMSDLMEHIEGCETCLMAVFQAMDKILDEDGVPEDNGQGG